MSREIPHIDLEATELDTKIDVYCEQKAIIDEQTADNKSLGESIKADMLKLGEKKHSTGTSSVTVFETTRDTVDEEALLNVMKKHNIEGVVKTKEYVDAAALENYLYTNAASKELMADIESCYKHTMSVVLRVNKGGKKNV